MSRKFRSEAMAALHEAMAALHEVGAIDKQTLRRFDEACLAQVMPRSQKQNKAIRDRECIKERGSRKTRQ
jgi:putative transcriptional regulator